MRKLCETLLSSETEELAREVETVFNDGIDENSSTFEQEVIEKVIRDERLAIRSYDRMIASDKISTNTKEIIREIKSDEEDHIVKLTALLANVTQERFPTKGTE